MMTRAVLLALSLTLAGCNSGGPSVSGSADEGARSSSGLSSLWERTRALGVDQTKTTDMPAFGIIADAFLQDASAKGLVPARVRIGSMLQVDGKVMRLDQLVAHDAAERLGTPPQTKQPVSLDEMHYQYATPLLIALAPLNGWEVEPMDDRKVDPAFDTPFFNQNRAPPRYNPEMHQRYMEMLSIAAIYSNDVFSRIAKSLGGIRLADPDDARQRVLASFQALPPGQLKALLTAAANQVAAGTFNTDLTNSGNVHFVNSAAGDFVGDPRGITWTRAGGIWFGDGRLAGQSVNFKLVSTSTLAQRQAQSGTQGTDTDASVRGTSSVGPGR